MNCSTGFTTADRVVLTQKTKGFADPDSMYDALVDLCQLAGQGVLPRNAGNVLDLYLRLLFHSNFNKQFGVYIHVNVILPLTLGWHSSFTFC